MNKIEIRQMNAKVGMWGIIDNTAGMILVMTYSEKMANEILDFLKKEHPEYLGGE